MRYYSIYPQVMNIMWITLYLSIYVDNSVYNIEKIFLELKKRIFADFSLNLSLTLLYFFYTINMLFSKNVSRKSGEKEKTLPLYKKVQREGGAFP